MLKVPRGYWWLGVAAGAAAFLAAPGPLPDKLAAVAAGVCPQRPSHSLFLAGTPLPLEARMTGIFGGFLATTLYAWLVGGGRTAPLPSRRSFTGLVGMVAVMGVDALNATAYDLGLGSLYQPNNGLRLATGLVAGAATGLLFLPLWNSWTWRAQGKRSTLRGPWEVAGLLATTGLIWLAGVGAWGWAFYPLALLSTAGLVLAVGMVNLLAVLTVCRRTQGAASMAELAPYGLTAFGMAAAELAGLAALRYAVLGVYLQ